MPGPFSDYITHQLQSQRQQAPQATGWEGNGGQVAHYINQFLGGVKQARNEKFLKDEDQRERQRMAYSHAIDQIQKSGLTDEAKQRFSTPLLHTLLGEVANTETTPVAKGGNPMSNFIKDTAVGMVGGKAPKQGKLDHMPLLEALAGLGDPTNTVEHKIGQLDQAAAPKFSKLNEMRQRGETVTQDMIATDPDIMAAINYRQQTGRQIPYSYQMAINSATPGPRNQKEAMYAQGMKRLAQLDTAKQPTQAVPQMTAPIPTVEAGKQADAAKAIQNQSNRVDPELIDILRQMGHVDDKDHNRHDTDNDKVVAARTATNPRTGEQITYTSDASGNLVRVPSHWPTAGPSNPTKPRQAAPGSNVVPFHGVIQPGEKIPSDFLVDKTTGKRVGDTIGYRPQADQIIQQPLAAGGTNIHFFPRTYSGLPSQGASPTAAPPIAGTGQGASTTPKSTTAPAQVAAPRATTAPTTINTAPQPAQNQNPGPGSWIVPSPVEEGDFGQAKRQIQPDSVTGILDEIDSGAINEENSRNRGWTNADKTFIKKTAKDNGLTILPAKVHEKISNLSGANKMVDKMRQFISTYKPTNNPLVDWTFGNFHAKVQPEAKALLTELMGQMNEVAKVGGEHYKVSDKDAERVVNLVTTPQLGSADNERRVQDYMNLISNQAVSGLKARGVQESQAKRIFERYGLRWNGMDLRPISERGNSAAAPLAPPGLPRPGGIALPRM